MRLDATVAGTPAYLQAMNVTVPEGTSGQVQVCRFTVSAVDVTLAALRAARYGRRSWGRAGTYTGLFRGRQTWMSDTPDEQRDHYPVLHAAATHQARRVLINGLGLGMVVAALLHMDHVEHIDVVEFDQDVIALVEPHYQQMAAQRGKTLTVHHGDAYTKSWPAGLRWDIAWHDIWQDLNVDNLRHMARLHRRYGRRVRWQGSWSRPDLERARTLDAWGHGY